MAERATKRAAVARLAMPDLRNCLVHQRTLVFHDRGEFDVALARHGADLERIATFGDVAQALDAVKVDDMIGRAKRFGTLPAIPSMQTPSGDVMLDPNAASALAMFTQNIQAPFTIIAATTPKVSHAPTGRIDMTISGTLAASL